MKISDLKQFFTQHARRLSYGCGALAIFLAASAWGHYVDQAETAELAINITASAKTGKFTIAEQGLRTKPQLWYEHEYAVSTYLEMVKADQVLIVGLPDASSLALGDPRILLVTREGELGFVSDTWRGSITDRTMAERVAGLHVVTVNSKPKSPPRTIDDIVRIVMQLVFMVLITFSMKDTFSFGGGRFKPTRKVTTRFSDVIGAAEAKAALLDVVNYLNNPTAFQTLGARPSRGVLLSGPPGTGKTLLARALAGECGVSFISCSGADFSSKFYGVGISQVKSLFRQARKESACIIFIDEIDGIGHRTGDPSGAGQENNRIINQILVELDGFNDTSRVIVIGATNLLHHIDPALTREGRFDRKIVLRLPDVADRATLLAHYSARLTTAENLDFGQLARMTTGLSPAAIASLVNQAAVRAARSGCAAVTLEHMSSAIETAHLGELSGTMMSSDERTRVAVHEASHALVTVLLKAGSLEKVTILPRGDALGVTFVSQDESKRMRTEKEMTDGIEVLLAGRCGEELALGAPSSGASHDLQVATNLMTDMVCRWGFGKGLAVLSKEQADANTVLQEVNLRLGVHYENVKKMLLSNNKALNSIIERLLLEETIDGSVVIGIIKANA